MGGVSGRIHSWMFNQKAFWDYLGIEGGKEDGADGKYIRETIERTGAFIIREIHYKDRGGKYQGQRGVTLPKT